MQEQKHDTPPRVVVLGAGPAGLATAHELSVRGAHVTVLERNDYVGGLCRTVDYKGFKFDLGGHRWFTKNEDLNTWFKRLMAGEIVDVDRVSRIFHNGTFYNYPIQVADVVRKMRFATLAHAAMSYFNATLVYGVFRRRIANIKDAFTAQFGRKLFGMFFRQYTEKVWGKPCEQLSADWVSQRSQGLSILSVLRNALTRRRTDETSLIEQFMYPRHGYMRIAERMAEDVRASGNTLTHGASVTGITYNAPNDYEVFYEQAGQTHSIAASHVVSTIPLGLMCRMITPACDDSVSRAAAELEFRDLITVNLIIRRQQVSPDTWLYVQNRDVIFGRIHEPKNWSPAMVPDDAHTSLVLECFCFRGDALWQADDEHIAQRCIDDLADTLGFVEKDDVVDWTLVRTTHAYPIYDLAYGEKLDTIRAFLDRFEGLEVAGRGGTFRYNNADHSIEMGLLLAREILGHGGDHMAVNTENRYQEVITEADQQARGQDFQRSMAG